MEIPYFYYTSFKVFCNNVKIRGKMQIIFAGGVSIKALGKIFLLLKATAEKPKAFGVFHVISLVVIILITAVICKHRKNRSEKATRRLLLIISLTVLSLEVYKQVIYSFSFNGETFSFRYEWHIFPWQFCSTPMFAGLAAALIKNRVIHRMLVCYLATYGLAAGVLISLFPSWAFSAIVGINIQTMYCHGSMITVGVFLLYSGYVKREVKTLFLSFFPFMLGVAIALLLNRATYIRGIPEGQVFNMYFISPYFKDDVPILEPFKTLLPTFLFQTVYVLVFSLFASVMLLIFGKRITTH